LERGPDPGLGSGYAVPDAFRAVPRHAAALSGALRTHRGMEPDCPAAPGGPEADRRRSSDFVRRSGDRGAAAGGGRTGGRAVRPRRPARFLVAGVDEILAAKIEIARSGSWHSG